MVDRKNKSSESIEVVCMCYVIKSQPRTPNQSGDITTYSMRFFSKKIARFVNRLILPFKSVVGELVRAPRTKPGKSGTAGLRGA